MPSYKDWKRRIEEKSDNETAFRLESEPVPIGERWCAQRIAVQDDDHDVDKVELAIRRIGYDHVFDYNDGIAVDVWFISKDPIYLLPSEKLVAILYDTTENDKCKLHITGYKESIK